MKKKLKFKKQIETEKKRQKLSNKEVKQKSKKDRRIEG